jgi:hypothetical protein
MRQIFGNVRSVAMDLLRTVTATRRVVPACAVIESVSPTLVYNLTLDRDNAYYANGILVFNCLTFAHPVAPRIGQRVRSMGVRSDYRPVEQWDRQSGGGMRASYRPYGM